MSRCLPAIDVPVAVRNGMRLGPGGDDIQQEFQAVLGFDAAEICAMRTEFAKEGLVMLADTLADHGNSEPRRGRRFWRRNRAQAIGVGERPDSKGVQLVGGPKVGRYVLHKLTGRIDPIGMFKLGGKTDLREA